MLWATAAAAQVTDVTVEIEPGNVGLGGFVRPGAWSPMIVTLDNPSPAARRVRCRWVIPDVDGDPVQFERVVSLTPTRSGRFFLYGAVPYNTPKQPQWRLLVIDDDSGDVMTSAAVPTGNVLPPRESAVGIIGSRPLGLQRFEQDLTQHETVRFIRGLDPAKLPDRWQGLDMIETLIWTPETTEMDPSSPSVSSESIKAVRRWIERGGHLVVVLPALGDDRWTNGPLNDVLPEAGIESVRGVAPPPALGSPREAIVIDVRKFTPGPSATVIMQDDNLGPWVIAHAFGAGRVTMIGVDISDRRLGAQGLPNAPDLWMKTFGWRSRSTATDIDAAQENARARVNQRIEAGSFVRPLIAMRESFSGALSLAVLVFMAYWLLAGPVEYWVLRGRGMVRHTWLGFVLTVAVFTGVCWGGAMLLRPKATRVSHVSVLDVNAVDGTVHSHSWLSLFVARHGRVNVAVAPDQQTDNYNTLAAMGLPRAELEAAFLDPQRYVVNAAAPHAMSVPYRSTAKQFEADYAGTLSEQPDANGVSWVMPQSYLLRIEDGFPRGQVSHGLPATLEEVLAVYCPGEGREPWVWQYDEWRKGQVLEIARPTVDNGGRLVVGGGENWQGWLTERIRVNKPGQRFASDEQSMVQPARNETIALAELLTFYGTLPPPNWWEKEWAAAVTQYNRALGRPFDISPMLQTRCLIIMGYMRDAPLPMPLHVDGEKVRGEGWTMVRWVCPL